MKEVNGKEYIYTDAWKMYNDIKDRNEQVLCCDIIPHIGYVLDPSGDIYLINPKDLMKSLNDSPGWKTDLIKSALTSVEGKHNLAKSLSGKK